MSSAVMVTELKSKTAGFVRTVDKPRFFWSKVNMVSPSNVCVSGGGTGGAERTTNGKCPHFSDLGHF